MDGRAKTSDLLPLHRLNRAHTAAAPHYNVRRPTDNFVCGHRGQEARTTFPTVFSLLPLTPRKSSWLRPMAWKLPTFGFAGGFMIEGGSSPALCSAACEVVAGCSAISYGYLPFNIKAFFVPQIRTSPDAGWQQLTAVLALLFNIQHTPQHANPSAHHCLHPRFAHILAQRSCERSERYVFRSRYSKFFLRQLLTSALPLSLSLGFFLDSEPAEACFAGEMCIFGQ